MFPPLRVELKRSKLNFILQSVHLDLMFLIEPVQVLLFLVPVGTGYLIVIDRNVKKHVNPPGKQFKTFDIHDHILEKKDFDTTTVT
jgi:hypothetical protein